MVTKLAEINRMLYGGMCVLKCACYWLVLSVGIEAADIMLSQQ